MQKDFNFFKKKFYMQLKIDTAYQKMRKRMGERNPQNSCYKASTIGWRGGLTTECYSEDKQGALF